MKEKTMTDIVYLVFHEAINVQTVNRTIDFTNKIIVQYAPSKICFLFSSGGGFVDSGVTLYNYLRGLPQTIIMHNIGSIDSIANAVFLAGKERYATPASAFLLHGISWTFQQNSALTYTQMQETVSRFDAAEQLSAQIIGERTSMTAEEVRALFRQGESKSPQFAKEKGLIHDIREVSIQPGSPLHAITAQA
jgi:ATP-dependent protease ClpP protease subunit